MLTLLSALGSLLSFRVRSRASLELELVALRHQLIVLRRQRPGQPRLFSGDRMLWVWLYRIWPRVLDAMVLVKPATVVQWHRKGFRLYWRRRSRHLGRPRTSREIRDLIRTMSQAEDSGEAARLFRDDGAHDSDMMPAGSVATLADGFVALGLCRRQSSNLFWMDLGLLLGLWVCGRRASVVHISLSPPAGWPWRRACGAGIRR